MGLLNYISHSFRHRDLQKALNLFIHFAVLGGALVHIICFHWSLFSRVPQTYRRSSSSWVQSSPGSSLSLIEASKHIGLGVDPCRLDDYVVWEDWKLCKTRQLTDRQLQLKTIDGGPGAPDVTFDDYIIQNRHYHPWSGQPYYSVVLLEFRALPKPLNFTIRNAMDNLPVHWPIQVLGGPSVHEVVRSLFPVETEAGKIIFTSLGQDFNHSRVSINEVFTDIDFYNRLLGEVWLFIQTDSVICRSQRHLLKTFIEKDRGWWGAPWSHWKREPRIGGNGGFSLRKKALLTTILARFTWDGVTPEDWWFCNKAAEIYQELPETLKPALVDDEMRFSAESIYSDKPFGIHKYWVSFRPFRQETRRLLEDCPETLGVFEVVYFKYKVYRDMMCLLNVNREDFDQATNITFDFQRVCNETYWEGVSER